MKIAKLFLCSLFLLTSCSGDGDFSSDASTSAESSGEFGSSLGNGQGSGQNTSPGQITAGEWNDLDSWSFWLGLIDKDDYVQSNSIWSFYTKNRLAFDVVDSNLNSVNGALLALYKDDVFIAESKTDNFGKTNLFINLYEESDVISDFSSYTVKLNSNTITQSIVPYSEGINQIMTQPANNLDDKIEISFIVDATGSMSDELEFLKSDLQDVISTVQNDNQTVSIYTSAVFYRDYDDDYLVKHSDFTSNINTTIDFIEQQYADGGGDFPEAVDVALSKSINDLQWSSNAKTKIAFLLLDAPPHNENQIINDIHQTVEHAAKNGIKIIPIAASGIDKPTEFLMRYLAITTNGTYVFITDDSGIGNDHLEPTVGEFQVEFLNELLVRLINKYSE